MKKHVFDIDVAHEVGVNAAILLENIAHWVEHNQANGANYHDGHYWTFNSMKAFEELFPYIKPRGIRTALNKLKEEGFIIVDNYNKSPYDRTQWYTLTEKAEAMLGIGTSICQKRQIKTSEVTNQNVTNDTPIPDVTSVVTSPVTSDVRGAKRKRFVPPTIDEVKAYCEERHDSVDPQKFLDYYEMTGWKTKGGATIKDWKACVRTWERNTRTDSRVTQQVGANGVRITPPTPEEKALEDAIFGYGAAKE